MATATTQPRRHSREEIDAQFALFHDRNPAVYSMFKQFALELWEAGRRKGSAEQIIQRMRWEASLKSDSENGFKISNYFRSRYARMLVKELPQFTDFFNFRSHVTGQVVTQ